jgi:hypothetical protein
MRKLTAPADIAARMKWLREVASGIHWSKFTRNGALTELHLLEDIYVA